MAYPRVFDSNHRSMWNPFVTKLIAGMIVAFVGGLMLTAFVGALGPVALAAWILPLVLLAMLAFQLREVPLRWRTTVRVDPGDKSLTLTDLSKERNQYGIVDREGQIYRFGDIEAYTSIQYESFISRPQYLIKILVDGKWVRLLSLRHPTDYLAFVNLVGQDIKRL